MNNALRLSKVEHTSEISLFSACKPSEQRLTAIKGRTLSALDNLVINPMCEQRLTAIKGRTQGLATPTKTNYLSEQRLTAIKGRTRQLPKPYQSMCPESILHASLAIRQH